MTANGSINLLGGPLLIVAAINAALFTRPVEKGDALKKLRT